MADEKPKPFNKILLYILIGLMILTGSINTIFNKILQKLDGKGVLFEQHHWIITFGMFLGELVSIFLYAYIVYKRKKEAMQKQDEALLRESEEKLETKGIPLQMTKKKIIKKPKNNCPQSLLILFSSLQQDAICVQLL